MLKKTDFYQVFWVFVDQFYDQITVLLKYYVLALVKGISIRNLNFMTINGQ